MTARPRALGMLDQPPCAEAAILSADRGGPVGIAFQVPELLMLAAWAEFHELRLVIELDHCVDGEEYEEVAVLYLPGSRLRQWMLWRAPDGVVVEPKSAAAFRVGNIADLFQRLVPVG